MAAIQRGTHSVQAVDVSLMVFLVVEGHDLLRDEGLEGVVRIRERGESGLFAMLIGGVSDARSLPNLNRYHDRTDLSRHG